MLEIVSSFIQTAQCVEIAASPWLCTLRDLKPNNTLRAADGTTKVIDLGQACKIGTKKERIQGTPDFISPEQVKCEPVGRYDRCVQLWPRFLLVPRAAKKLPTLFTLNRGENSFLARHRNPQPPPGQPGSPRAPLEPTVMDWREDLLVAKRPEIRANASAGLRFSSTNSKPPG